MELAILVGRKWTLCFLASLLGFILLLCYLDQVREFMAPVEILHAQPGKLDLGKVNPWNDNSMQLLLQGNKVRGIQPMPEKCDIFDGEWVYDPQAYPLYSSSDCPFLSDQVNCQNNGRPDSNYQSWRWKARNCHTARFNATKMLEKLKGKRVVFVGDSLNRNQWESLACLLYSRIPTAQTYINVENGLHKVFHAKDYNCTVEFFWSPFLVELQNQRVEHRAQKVLKLGTMSSSAKHWKGAEIMIFNSGHWWLHRGKLKAWDLLENGGELIEDMAVEEAFRKAMQTWAQWIDSNVNPSQTTVFFRSISPEHKGGKQWCYTQTQPHMDRSHLAQFTPPTTALIEKTIREMKTPVVNLNVTGLSQYRVDAHTSVYTERRGKLLTAEQRRQPSVFADCSHWCLPGLPDTWNELLFQSLILQNVGQSLQ